MLADDVFRNGLRELIAELRTWTLQNADCATVEEAETDAFWRFAVSPRSACGCPLEIIVHRDQHYDAQIGDEVYEGLSVERLDLFARLVDAIAGGRVITRTWATPATGAVHSVETIVDLPGGTLTGERRIDTVAALADRAACVARDRHWVPYRR